jgi:hypothetical protein
MMALRRRPPAPCPCGCEQLEQRLAEYEDAAAALARAMTVLRPRAAGHSAEQGLVGWGVAEADARRIALLARKTAGDGG